MTFRPTLTEPKVIWAIGYRGVSHSGSGRDLIRQHTLTIHVPEYKAVEVGESRKVCVKFAF